MFTNSGDVKEKGIVSLFFVNSGKQFKSTSKSINHDEEDIGNKTGFSFKENHVALT